MGENETVEIAGVGRLVNLDAGSGPVRDETGVGHSLVGVARIVNVDPQPCASLNELAGQLYTDAGSGGADAELGGVESS